MTSAQPGSTSAAPEHLTSDQRNSFIAALLGWMMDAFDYFIVVFVYADIAKDFHISLAEVAFLTTATLLRIGSQVLVVQSPPPATPSQHLKQHIMATQPITIRPPYEQQANR